MRGLGRAGLLTDAEVDELDRRTGRARRSRRGGHDRVGPGARGHPPQPRVGAGRADRPGRRQAPHGPLAQRPGRDRPAPLAAPRDRSTRWRAARLRARARRARRARGDRRAAGHDPHPARPARAVRPPPAGLRRDGRAGPRPAGRCAPADERLAARGRRAGRRRLPARSRGDGRRARLRRGDGELARCRERSRLRGRGARARSRSGWSTSAGWRRRSPGGRTRGSGSCARAMRSRPARRSCPTRRTPTRPSWSAAARPASSGR